MVVKSQWKVTEGAVSLQSEQKCIQGSGQLVSVPLIQDPLPKRRPI